MKTLYILRHAQKDESKPEQYDYDIELTQKGEENSKLLGEKLKSKNILPDLIVSSPAIRARKTAENVSEKIGYTKSVMYNEVIYQAFLHEIVESITYTFDTVDSLMIVGHNPSLSALAITYAGFKEEMDMASVVRIDFNCSSWTSIDKSNAKLIEYIKL
ncbi:MAG: phosphoglycerate mutase [Arcobacter sp.]|nr:MAG: phosphoglycerate mutase [Arcobacter sp.]